MSCNRQSCQKKLLTAAEDYPLHFHERWALSSPRSCFSADAQPVKQGECWGLTSEHFPLASQSILCSSICSYGENNSCGHYHIAVITADGKIYLSGGQLDDCDTIIRGSRTLVLSLKSSRCLELLSLWLMITLLSFKFSYSNNILFMSIFGIETKT